MKETPSIDNPITLGRFESQSGFKEIDHFVSF
jgi:hypothetical protein